jgi:hypothetical protein
MYMQLMANYWHLILKVKFALCITANIIVSDAIIILPVKTQKSKQ